MDGDAACGRPGCAGTIEDGYCDTCGLAQRSAAAAGGGPSSAPQAPAGAAGPRRCARPGCAGAIEDGYCDTCGMAAKPDAAAHPSGAAVPSARTGSARGSLGSGRTDAGRSRGSAVSARAATGRSVPSQGSRSGSGRGGLGLGLVEIPEVEKRDPAEAVLSDPEVPEHKRYCSKCAAPVGRARDGRPGRTGGYCAKCGSAYDFAPKLASGELVGGQYEVLGCIAHGGLGWIYLARDNNVSGRWVALKGLLDTGDADAMAAAAAERQALAEVEHPNVVKIYNFVRHRLDDYIVMEYVGGKSLKQIALDHKDATGGDPLPLARVLAYAVEILPAFGYLHSIGLLYCDFKPDNVIQSEEQLKLIDMGAVRAFDDEVSAVYGTVGYQAPEIAALGPSIESDLFTVGRMMAVLAFDFRGYTSTYATSLPPRESVPLLVAHESFDRALRRATHPRRESRFSSAAEMAVQLTGVLREVLALGDGRARPAVSRLFTGEQAAVGVDLGRPTGPQFAAALPVPTVDPADANAGLLATLGGTPKQVVNALSNLPQQSVEAAFRKVRATIEDGRFTEAQDQLDALHGSDAYDWRVGWYRGVLALARGDASAARAFFDACYDELPGEQAPKLGLAVCAELAGRPEEAVRYYRLVWSVDRSFATAAFALARLQAAAGDHAAAVATLAQVPHSSIHRGAAQIAAIRTRIGAPGFPGRVTAQELAELAGLVQALGLDGEAYEALACLVLQAALDWALAHPGSAPSGGPRVFGALLNEREIRLALERSFRARARMAPDRAHRVALVDRANSLRPRTLV